MSGGGWGALRVYPLSSDEGDAVPIGGSGVLVGRENADIELPEDTFVSGAHCQFSCRDEGLFVEDLGSANGTYTRVRKGEAVPFGAQLLLGQTLFTVRRAGG
jgi:pSer/pThr/pTyr-binding forkhead associated (FHA) protein